MFYEKSIIPKNVQFLSTTASDKRVYNFVSSVPVQWKNQAMGLKSQDSRF